MLQRFFLALIRFYQRAMSPLMGDTCRFQPTCSDYAALSIERFGVLRGSWLAVRRLSRCRPFGGSGYDPVPEAAKTLPGSGPENEEFVEMCRSPSIPLETTLTG